MAIQREYRSRRARLSALSKRLRDEGYTWTQIASRIKLSENVNMLVAFRLAHGWSQAYVAQSWNTHWPSVKGRAGISDKNISYWETWPHSGFQPSLRTYKRLAQLYQCDVGDLIGEGKYSDLDDAKQEQHAQTYAGPSGQVAQEGSAGRLPANRTTPVDTGVARNEIDPFGKLIELGQNEGSSALQREAVYEELVQLLASWADSMKRRELLRVLGCAATAAAASPIFPGLNLDEQVRVVTMLDGRHRVDDSAIGHIETVLWSTIRQDDSLGPQAALDTVLAQRNLVRGILPECPPSLQPRLLSLFSRLTQFSGWLSYDLGDFASASHYYEQARLAAHEAENTELGVFTLCNMSLMATWRGQPRIGIDHAVAAQRWAKETADPVLNAYVADVAARAYAAAGMRSSCLEALRSVPAGINRGGKETPATSLVYFYGPGGYASTRARCLLLLDDARAAAEAARESLALIDPSFVRNRAFTVLYLANAYAATGEIEGAAQTIGDAAELGARNRSARLDGKLRESRIRLSPWDGTAAVRALDERLGAHGLAPRSSV